MQGERVEKALAGFGDGRAVVLSLRRRLDAERRSGGARGGEADVALRQLSTDQIAQHRSRQSHLRVALFPKNDPSRYRVAPASRRVRISTASSRRRVNIKRCA